MLTAVVRSVTRTPTIGLSVWIDLKCPPMANPRTFISFGFDHDRVARILFVGAGAHGFAYAVRR
jgi:hypothetical protein